MKKIVLFAFVILMSVFTSFGQDRINEPTYSFKNKSNLITNITGWCFDELEGQWFGNANCIRGEKMVYRLDKRFCKNIKSIQIKTFENNGVTNYALIIAYNGGHYRYPSIYEDWRGYIEYQVYSLTKDEYETIISPNVYHDFTLPCITYNNYYNQKTDNYVIREIIRNNINIKTEQKTDNYVISEIFKPEETYSLYLDGLSIKRYNDVIRFNYQTDETTGGWNMVKSLEKRYFEIPITEWEKLKIE